MIAKNGPTSFRSLLRRPELIVAPGAYDAITARLVHQAGFDAVYMTGAGVSASLGYPDYGLLTMSEMVDRAAVIANAVPIPLISDADTGYGNALNVTRTVREFEARGAAAIHIEDQVSPKRCGHLEGKELIALDEYVAKIRAAVSARTNPAFTIIARSDARAVTSLDDAIERVNAALAAGADVAFVESPIDRAEIEAIPRRVAGPCVLNLVHGGKTPVLPLAQVEAIGYRVAIIPGATLVPAILACDAALEELARSREVRAPDSVKGVHAVFRRFGADEWDEIRRSASAPLEREAA